MAYRLLGGVRRPNPNTSPGPGSATVHLSVCHQRCLTTADTTVRTDLPTFHQARARDTVRASFLGSYDASPQHFQKQFPLLDFVWAHDCGFHLFTLGRRSTRGQSPAAISWTGTVHTGRTGKSSNASCVERTQEYWRYRTRHSSRRSVQSRHVPQLFDGDHFMDRGLSCQRFQLGCSRLSRGICPANVPVVCKERAEISQGVW